MVLINNLTIDEINAALLHLQRARTEVVGGTKGSTVQNITISNKGGGSTVDYAPTITALSNRIDKNTDDIESVEDEIDKIQETLEQLSDNGISSMTFDPVTRQLQINAQDGEVYSCDITSENITLNFNATTNKLTLEMGEQYQEVTLPYINANEKGSANGVATLDSSGRVPYSQLPESAMEFLGQWNASTNTPHLADGTGTNGDFYVCNVGGTVTFGTGNTQTFVPNDRVIYNGATSQWIKLPAGQVSSVNGMSGDVTLTATNIEYSTGVSIKAKIDANAVQADWNVTDTTSLAYIKNKPTIPASPVQSDWNVTDTTSLAYIKNKPSVAVLGNTAGCALGTASAGSCTTAARSDHVHPLPICVQIGGYLGERAALGCATNCTYGVANVWNYCSDSRYYLIGTKYDNPSCKYNVRVDYATNATTSCCTKYLYACDATTIGAVVEGGNEFNFKNVSTIHMWLNWRGGVSNVIIGSGNSDGCCGTLRAALYCGGVADAGNGTATTFAYSKQGLQSNPSWLAAWNGYELRAVSPSVVCVACADSVNQTDAVKNLKSSSGKYYVALTGGSNYGPVVVPDGTELTYCIDTGTLVAKCFKDIYCNTMITNFGQIMNCPGGDLYRLGCTGIFRFKSELWCTKGCDLYCAIYNAMSCAFDDGWSLVCRYVVGTMGSWCDYRNGCYRRMDIACVSLQNGQLYISGGDGYIDVSCGQTSCVITGYLDFIFPGKWSGF